MTMKLEATWHNPPLDHFEAMKVFIEWGDDIGPYIRSILKERTPVVTGRMKESERYARNGFADGVRLEWRAYTPYAKYVIDGTKPHVIEAVASRYLHFWWHGQEMFLKRVHHPGNDPNDFPRQVFDAVKDEVVANLKQRIDAALRGKES